MFKTFRDVIAIWKTPDELAEHLQALGYDIGIYAVRNWKIRDNIPSPYWVGVIDAAGEKGRAITAAELAQIAAKQREAAA